MCVPCAVYGAARGGSKDDPFHHHHHPCSFQVMRSTVALIALGYLAAHVDLPQRIVEAIIDVPSATHKVGRARCTV